MRHWPSWHCLALSTAILAFPPPTQAQIEERPMIAGHVAHFDAAGHLLPWISWSTALEREMLFYQQCPTDHGYPRFVTETFLEGDWSLVPDRHDTIPATQNGMGILSYLKLYALRDRRDALYLATARAM